MHRSAQFPCDGSAYGSRYSHRSDGSNSTNGSNGSNRSDGSNGSNGSNRSNGSNSSNSKSSLSCSQSSRRYTSSKSEELSISISISLGVGFSLSLNMMETSSYVSDQASGLSHMYSLLSTDLLHNVLALLSQGGVDDSSRPSRALLLSNTLLLISTLLGLLTLLLHITLLHLSTLLLRDILTLLLRDLIHNVPTLLLSNSSTLFPGHLSGHSLALLHWLAATLLLWPSLVVSDSLSGTDWFRYSGTCLSCDSIIHCVTFGCYSYCTCYSMTMNMTMNITLSFPCFFRVCIRFGESQGRDEDQEKNKLLHDDRRELPTAR